MEVIISPTADESAVLAAEAIADLLRGNPRAVLGLATGSSPLAIYRELAHRVETGTISLAGVSAYMLDEYVGLPRDHPQRYRNVIRRDFVDLVGIEDQRVHGPDTTRSDLERAALQYEDAIRASGGIDLQILGLGTDGHVAFNEPSSSLGSRTRLKTLSRQTRSDNARFFEGRLADVPRQCLTQGVATILDARHVVLTAAGKRKARAVRDLVEGPVTAMCPGSALQLHPRVTVLLDEEAASQLKLRDYYRDVRDAKAQLRGREREQHPSGPMSTSPPAQQPDAGHAAPASKRQGGTRSAPTQGSASAGKTASGVRLT